MKFDSVIVFKKNVFQYLENDSQVLNIIYLNCINNIKIVNNIIEIDDNYIENKMHKMYKRLFERLSREIILCWINSCSCVVSDMNRFNPLYHIICDFDILRVEEWIIKGILE